MSSRQQMILPAPWSLIVGNPTSERRSGARAPHGERRRSQMEENTQAVWPGGVAPIPLFVEDLPAAKRFYSDVFRLPVHFEDDNSTVFKFGDTLVNLLQTSEAPGLVAPATVANPDAGVRFQFTLAVDDVDAMVEELKSRGVDLLNGPMDRPWGIRPASFRDPGGHIWEVGH